MQIGRISQLPSAAIPRAIGTLESRLWTLGSGLLPVNLNAGLHFNFRLAFGIGVVEMGDRF